MYLLYMLCFRPFFISRQLTEALNGPQGKMFIPLTVQELLFISSSDEKYDVSLLELK